MMREYFSASIGVLSALYFIFIHTDFHRLNPRLIGLHELTYQGVICGMLSGLVIGYVAYVSFGKQR